MFILEEVNTEIQNLFQPNNMWLSTLYCALIIIGFYLIMWGKKKIFKKHKNKATAILDISLNIIITIAFIVLILVALGFNIIDFINQNGGITKFLENNAWRLVAIVLVIIISSIVFNSIIAIIQSSYKKSTNMKRRRTMDKVIISILKYVILIIDAIIILYFCGVNVIPALTGLGIAGLVIGLGAQKLIADFISGAFIIFEHHFDVGDVIDVGGFKGEVIDIGLKTTKIRNWQGDVKIMPNGDVINIINCSLNETTFTVEFSIAYAEDTEKVKKIINEELPKRMDDEKNLTIAPVCNGVNALGDSSVVLNIVATAKAETHYAIRRRLNEEIKHILDEHNIEIPFPQVVVHQEK